jgi:tyrosine-protein kinase Etk/Wzc
MAENSNSFIINKSYDPLLFRTIIRRYWWWVPIILSIVFFLAAIYLRYTKPVYEADLILQIENEDNAKNVIDIENINTKKDIFFSEVELLKSELLFNQALSSLSLDVSIFYKGKILTEEKYKTGSLNIQPYDLKDSSLVGTPITVDFQKNKIHLSYQLNGKQYHVAEEIGQHFVSPHFDIVIKIEDFNSFLEEIEGNEIYFTFNSIQNLSQRYFPNLNVLPVDERARTVLIGFRGDNPRICHDIVLALSNQFIQYSVKVKKKSSENILNFIDLQLDSLSTELKKSKDSLMNFQRASNISDPEQEGTDVKSDATKFQEELFNLEDEIRTLQDIYRRLVENPNRLDIYRILPELLGKSYETAISGHIESLHTLLEEKEDILFKLTPESSEVKRVDRKIQEKTKQIIRSIDAIESRLKARSKLLKEKIGVLETEYSNLPGKRMEFNRLKNIQDLNEKYFQLLTEKKVQYSISDAGFSSNNRVLKNPIINPDPVEPRSTMIYSGFLLIGLFISLGVMFLKYVSFNEINLIEDLQNILPDKATILGGVPMSKFNMEYSQIVVTQAPKSMMAEAMRKIRVNLSYIKPNYKTIAISSSISGEGKTFVALNLAAIVSMTGKKTILLDLDMRKPKVHLAFGLNNENGMSNLIIGSVQLEDVIHKNVDVNMDIITSGPIPPNPSELLLGRNFKKIIEQLKEIYDVIVIDNPPIGLVSDGIQILTEADIPIYVFKSQYSKRNFAFRVKELFEMQQVNSLNIILNGIVQSKKNVYGYGYGYGSYEGYMEDETKKEVNFIQKIIRFIKGIFKK